MDEVRKQIEGVMDECRAKGFSVVIGISDGKNMQVSVGGNLLVGLGLVDCVRSRLLDEVGLIRSQAAGVEHVRAMQ